MIALGRLGPFRLEEKIGVGGMSLVYRGVHVGVGGEETDVAVKVMRSELTASRSFRENFRREIRSVARLNHPCIVKLLDAGEVTGDDHTPENADVQPGSSYLVMQLVHGGSLSQFDDLDFPTLKGLMLDLLDGLAHAHAIGIVHRDLKPGNILVDETARGPRLLLTDFGIAHALDLEDRADGSEVEKRISGTPKYMAPERILGRWREQGPWTDLYSLGVMCWRLVCGEAPFVGKTSEVMKDHLQRPLPRFSPAMPIPPGFEAWLRRLLAKSPAARFRRAADAAFGLLSLTGPAVFGAAATEVESRSLVGLSENLPTLVALESEAVATESQIEVVDGLEHVDWPVPSIPQHWERVAEPEPIHLLGAGLGLHGLRVTPVVGRTAERTALWAELRAVAEGGEPRAVVLVGDRGLGKTRLLDWLAVRASELGSVGHVLRLRHSPNVGPQDGLGPMVARLTRAVGLDRSATSERVEQFLEDHGLGDRLRDVLVDLIAPREGEVQRRTRREVHAGTKRLVRGLATDRPLLLIVDDAQWGRDSLAFVATLLADSTLPVFVVAAFATDEPGASPDALEGRHVARVPVEPLGQEQTARLVGSLLGVSPELADRLCTAAHGNPLYLVEAVGGWVNAGLMEASSDGFVLGRTVELPDGIDELWSDRIAKVCASYEERAESARIAIEVAAVLGHDVDTGEWRLATRAAGANLPDDLVGRLADASLAVETDHGWRFAHGLIADTIYAELSTRREHLERLHGACLRTLDLVHGSSGDPGHSIRRARHAAAAGQPDVALERYESANALLVHRGNPHRVTEVLDEQSTLLDAIDASPDHELRLSNQVWRARLSMYLGRHDAAISQVEDVLERAEATGAPRTVALASRLLAMLVSSREPDRAVQLYEQSLRTHGVLGDDVGRARVLLNTANLYPAIGRLDDARLNVNMAEQIARRTGDAALELEVAFQRGQMDRAAGELEGAREHFTVAMERAGAVGWRSRYADALGERADVLRMLGDLETAERDMRRVFDIRQEIGEEDLQVLMLNLALVRLDRGNYQGAVEIVTELVDEFRALDTGMYLQFGLSVYAAALAGVGDFERLGDVLLEYERLAERLGTVDPDLARTLQKTAILGHEAGRDDLAARALAQAVAQREALGDSEEAEELRAMAARWGEVPQG